MISDKDKGKGEGKEEEEDTEFVLDTTGDPALQEDFLPSGNEYDFTEEKDKGSIDDAQIGCRKSPSDFA